MSMTEPFQPHPGPDRADTVPAAEPGPGGPPPAAEEEPDVLPDAQRASGAGGTPDGTGADSPADTGGHTSPTGPGGTPFRTPVPGERLTPGELTGDDPA